MRSLTLLLVAFLALSSCCQRTDCAVASIAPPAVHITFYGFQPGDLDTIYTTGYAPGSYFTAVTRAEAIDSATRRVDSPTVYMFRPKASNGELITAHEWKLYLPSVNKTYHISDYVYETRTYTCGSCGGKKTMHDRYLTTCKVDGVAQPATGVRISK